MNTKLRPLSRARVPNAKLWELKVAQEVRGLMAVLGAAGWSMLDVAESLGVSRSSLYRWRTGEDDTPGSKLEALRALVADVVGERRSA